MTDTRIERGTCRFVARRGEVEAQPPLGMCSRANDAAHELKTDVAIVKSSLQLLAMRKRTFEEYGQGLALTLEDITRLESTVEKMLTLARLEQPTEDYNSATVPQSCSLRDVIEDAVNQSKPLAQLKSIEIARLHAISQSLVACSDS